MPILLKLLAISVGLLVLAPSDAFSFSAQREESEEFESALERNYRFPEATSPERGRVSALGAARPLSAIAPVTARMSYAEIAANFRRMRDERFLSDPQHAGLRRRVSWLYPRDGCIVRAELGVSRATRALQKIFAFGNLRARTRFAPRGAVYWWFHAAPIAADASGRAWVLDPAVEPSRPLSLHEWKERIGGDRARPRFAVCSSNTYAPGSACHGAGSARSQAIRSAGRYLRLERANLRALGYDATKLLGIAPPW